VRADGALSLVNNPAKRLMGLNQWSRIDAMDTAAPGLTARLQEIPAGAQRLLQVSLRGVPAELRVSVSEVRQSGGIERLYAIENLAGELTARESSAWRNLIRVLTHEMMNTLTPITSLAQTARQLLGDAADDAAAREDIEEALATIERRGGGLMRFVSRYREFMQVPEPRFAEVLVKDLVDSVISLERGQLGGIEVLVSVVPESLMISADRELLDQVLLNIVKNAREAMDGVATPKLSIEASLQGARVVIAIGDTGPGIPDDLLDQVFIPFFTTRATGSGVGLALSRQIMNAHGGDIVIERAEPGTRIRLLFG
jgi:nitrogen fixation/metabolism regulation signal transduction histidine kinase